MFSDSLFRLGWNSRFSDSLPDGCVPGRVVRVDRDRVLVATSDGPDRHAHARPLPAVGDWVALTSDAVTAVLPRSSALVRRDPGRPVEQVLAANVDVVFVVAALDPGVNLRRLERTLVVAWDSGAVPVVVLTKPDRCPDVGDAVAAVRAVAMGVDVLVVNGLTGNGLDEVQAHLSGDDHSVQARSRTGLFLGASGAGKSTLTNLLLDEERLATQEVREVDKKGRHTTSARHLIVVPSGGVVIDTPGLRGLALWDVDEGVAAAFADIEELAAGCRFRDCRHQAEPGCAVAGRVDPDRLRNWRHLAQPVDPVEARRRGRIMEKAIRQHYKLR